MAGGSGSSRGPSEPVWTLAAHTKAKHDLLRVYLDAWFPIMANRGFRRRVLYIDGFAGPGKYEGGEMGSPLLALSRLVDHPFFSRWNGTEFCFLFFESEEDRFESLCDELTKFWAAREGQPANVRVEVRNARFADGAEALLAELGNRKLAPTFAFIDPFGFSGVPLDLIARLLAYDECEVFFNFMFNDVNRFATAPKAGVDHHFVDLFGCDLHSEAPPAGNPERGQYLHDLYQAQLTAVGGFKFVRSFEMRSARNRVQNYLFYGTRHLTGLEKMKDAMWKVDPVRGERFFAADADIDRLFQEPVDPDPLRTAILGKFVGQAVSIRDLEEFVIGDTRYRTTHLRQLILRPMEAAGEIEVVRPGKNGFPSGTVISFR